MTEEFEFPFKDHRVVVYYVDLRTPAAQNMCQLLLLLLASLEGVTTFEYVDSSGKGTMTIRDQPPSITSTVSSSSIQLNIDKFVEVVRGAEVVVQKVDPVGLLITSISGIQLTPRAKMTELIFVVRGNISILINMRMYLENGTVNFDNKDVFNVVEGSVGLEFLINSWPFSKAAAARPYNSFLDVYLSVISPTKGSNITSKDAAVTRMAYSGGFIDFSRMVSLDGTLVDPPQDYPKFLADNRVVVRFPYYDGPVMYRLSLTGSAIMFDPRSPCLVTVLLLSALFRYHL